MYIKQEGMMQMTFTKLPKSITAEELLSTPLPPVKWIIPGLLPAGLALFAGPSKAGKSWLTLWLCLQIAQGNPVWNREIEPRTVIYFSLEDTFNRLQNRIFQLIDGGDAPERLILQTECPSIGQGLEEQVESLIHTYRDVGLVVIDTLQKVRVSDGNGGMYANDYKEAGALKKLADKYGICILLIHHLRKQTASDPFEQISGSTGLMGVADTSWVMQRKRMSQTADILLTGRDMDDRTLHLREKNCVWTLEDEETAEEREIKTVPDYLWKVAEYIESVGNWQGTASELLAAAGIENAKPNQFTYNMAKYFDKVFEPKNIRYKTHRKNKVRLLSFYGDDGDGGDDDIDITQLSGWGIPERPSPSSPYAGYKRNLDIVYPLIGGIPLAKLLPMTLEEMCEELRKRPGRGGNCIKETTVQKYLETVSSVLEDAKKNDIIPFNPAHRVRKKHIEKEVQHIPQKYEMGKLMRAIQNEPILYRAYYTLAITTGLRRGELCALQWRDITGACELTVRRSRSCASGQIVESDTKSHRERIVTIPLGIWELLMALRQQQVLHSGVPDREQPIFTDPDGHVPHPDTFTRHLRKLYKQCGLSEDYHLHTLRHFYATYLLQEGTSKQVAASLLGHADTAFLERTYCHPQDAVKLQAANLMQDLLNSQNPCYVAFMKNKNRKAKKAG